MQQPRQQIYQQHEEDEEDVGEEINGPQRRVGLLDVSEVEVAQDHPEQGVHGVDEAAEVAHLGGNNTR